MFKKIYIFILKFILLFNAFFVELFLFLEYKAEELENKLKYNIEQLEMKNNVDKNFLRAVKKDMEKDI